VNKKTETKVFQTKQSPMATRDFRQSIYSADADEAEQSSMATGDLRQSIYSADADESEKSPMATGDLRQSIYSADADDAVGGRVSNLCHPCVRDKRTSPATLRCTTCNERLCDRCSKNHQIYIPGHNRFVDYHDTTIIRTLVDMKGFDKCMEHGNTVVYQCKNHNVLCCADCHYENHNKCEKLIKLSQLTERHDSKDDSVDFKQSISDCISLANNVASDSDKKTIDVNNDNICNEIDRARKKLIQMFDEAKIRLQQELTDSNKREIQRLQVRKSTALAFKLELEKSQSVHQLVQRNGTTIQKYIMHAVIRNKLWQAEKELYDMLKNDYTVHRMLEWDTSVLTVLNTQGIEVALKVGKNLKSLSC